MYTVFSEKKKNNIANILDSTSGNITELRSELSTVLMEERSTSVLTDASVLITRKLVAVVALAPVASQQVATHRVGATAMDATCTFIDI
jgi:hypothetical protein